MKTNQRRRKRKAKETWQSLVKESNAQTRQERGFVGHSARDFHMFNDSGLWTLKGKYYGEPVRKLPYSYMKWILENVNSSIHCQIIEKEMRVRNIKKIRAEMSKA